jgi:hypothetical protein
MEEPTIIRMNIGRYRALLERDLSPDKRSTIEKLLVEADRALVLAAAAARKPR